VWSGGHTATVGVVDGVPSARLSARGKEVDI
jgi:hypothetical protein